MNRQRSAALPVPLSPPGYAWGTGTEDGTPIAEKRPYSPGTGVGSRGAAGRTDTDSRGPGVDRPDGAESSAAPFPRGSRATVTRGGRRGWRSPPAPSHDSDEAVVMPLARGLLARAAM